MGLAIVQHCCDVIPFQAMQLSLYLSPSTMSTMTRDWPAPFSRRPNISTSDSRDRRLGDPHPHKMDQMGGGGGTATAKRLPWI